MLEWIKLFPPYLIFLTVVFVIIPSFASFLIRLSIYKYLNDLANKVIRLLRSGESRGIQPKIVEELEKRYKESITQLEQVNTAALIDGVYSQEKFRFFGFSLRCEQWDHFCKILPNLLLAFGLLGTFLGITLNLYNLSQTINGIENDVSSLVQQLQTPLQSMGIAFITSLIALVCSSFLIVINLRCNTNLAKVRLISSLEDYLDNIFKSKVQGDSRLDKAVNRMVEQQHEFLTRFHEKVGQVLESTLGRAADKIAEENKISNALAREVYERFLESSGTLARSANTFQEAASFLDKQVESIADIVPHFQKSCQTLENSALVFLEASEKIEKSKFSENLETITADLAKTQKAFSQSTAFLGNNMHKLIDNNQKATKLAEKVYNQLQESSAKLQNSATSFLEASETIKQSQFADKLSAATTDLATMQNQFAQAASTLNQSTQSIEIVITNLQNSVQRMVDLGDRISGLNQQSAKIIDLTETRLTNEKDSLNHIQVELNNLIKILKENEQNTNLELQKLGDRFIANTDKQLGNNSKQIQILADKFARYISELIETKSNLTNLVNTLKENTKQTESNFQFWGERITTVIERETKRSNEQSRELFYQLAQYIHKNSEVPSKFNKLEELKRDRLDSSGFNGKTNHKNS
ncbi:hypothetical protein NIES593_03395 [Hydrococcus rivularis NIES-593]|uniref:Methyl-accepting chemotaxis protein n=1 Tax=Hydrococcus rivularis NIES-593 TaxID=1921803 RepID=A0A1U7HRD3_9CYAN|nr:methyl-accepting chemotaxis protein [Hydrococcus rivularis]OKH26131.1 hypothetical protein NIES593_03395 [Hydrococcus rivularis NIES-593]